MRAKQTDSKMQINLVGSALYVLVQGDVVDYDIQTVWQQIKTAVGSEITKIIFKPDHLQAWDSSLILLVYETIKLGQDKNIEIAIEALPQNLQDLVNMAFAVDRKPEKSSTAVKSLLEYIGRKTVGLYAIISDVCGFIGEVFCSLLRFLSFRSIMRRIDFCAALQDCGPKALLIVSLISFLVGLILAFVGAVQLQTFGAQIYVASLVTIGMCRIMGAIMVGIIMAGRTGSAYAATIGTMQVNEELDALQTMGLSRIDFLVLPRLLALILAMPILTMLADIMGMLGGAFIGVFMMDLPYQEYWKYAFNAFNLNNFLVGIFHGFCFGFIIALCGCYSGLTCGRNADSVGVATTRSVVNAIVWMIVVTGIITVICQEIGI